MSYQVPRGTQDILPKDISKWHRLEDLIRQFCHVYDYEEIRTPIFEHTNVFKRGNDSSDMVRCMDSRIFRSKCIMSVRSAVMSARRRAGCASSTSSAWK